MEHFPQTRNENLPPKEEEEAREGFQEHGDIEHVQKIKPGIIRTRTGMLDAGMVCAPSTIKGI
jgi:hypothetical protein